MDLPEELASRPARKPGQEPTASLTLDAYRRLKAELDELKTDGRTKIAERLLQARELGDISENAEYDHAKNEQAMLEARIAQLEEKLRSATVIDERAIESGVVSIGSKVHVKDQKSGQSVAYQIVGSAEADPAENKLSNESPVGSALIGKKRGDVVSVAVPRGPARKLKITKISAD